MKYEVWFKLINEERENDVNFKKKEYAEAIKTAIKKFNEAGDIARNKKRIINQDIQEHLIKIYFNSDIELEKPTKSFRYFSKDLIDYSEDFRELVVGGRLLKGVYSSKISDEENEQGNVVMSDEQMIITLIHWCMSREIQGGEEKKNKQNAIEKIKELIKECITISQ